MSRVSSELYNEVQEVLAEEAALLDDGRFDAWLEFLTDDVVYQAPVRVTRGRDEAAAEVSSKMFHFDETRGTLGIRVRRLASGTAWAEDPPSRTRHLIGNVSVKPGERLDELFVTSALLVYRNRGDDPSYDLISAERRDTLRRVDGVLRLARRMVVIDQATLGTRNLGIFL